MGPEHLVYMTTVDELLRHEADEPTIGLPLCKTKNEAVAEYALRDTTQPLGVAEYQLVEALPDPLHTALPTIEQIKRALGATVSRS
ncbi:PDDEXK nuclease domain-containing protein [Leucobacter massiliensis]|uniref:PDDEXK nuclease domain-containing protein n=1 Tax=Leucobacter massiliensis TaxID=1686285 RepID=UPI001C613B6E|nr:PDDEXK nuclease domain-containing protein [Leucobacter massiliensis]